MSNLWPRLPGAFAEELLESIRKGERPLTPSTVEHPRQIYAPTGGSRATASQLQSLRDSLLAVAKAHGFPEPADDAERIQWDRETATTLYDQMQIVPAEAATPTLWSHLSLIVAPDIVKWRFGFGNPERWIASDLTRHTFSRLWWQAHILGGEEGLLDRLNESTLNQLLERTTLGGIRPLVRELARQLIEHSSEIPHRTLVRQSTARLRRQVSYIEHLSLSPKQLTAAVNRVLTEVVDAYADQE